MSDDQEQMQRSASLPLFHPDNGMHEHILLSRPKAPGRSSNLLNAFFGREVIGPKPITHFLPTSWYTLFKLYKEVQGHTSAISCVNYDKAEKVIITGGNDNKIKIWSATDGSPVQILSSCHTPVLDMAFDQSNELLAVAHLNNYIAVWDLKANKLLYNVQEQTIFFGLRFWLGLTDPSKGYLMAACINGTIIRWEYNLETKVFRASKLPVSWYLIWLVNTNLLILTDYKKRYGMPVDPPVFALCMHISPSGNFIALGFNDNNLRVYEIGSPEGPAVVHNINWHTHQIECVKFSHHSPRFVSYSQDGANSIFQYDGLTWERTAMARNNQARETLRVKGAIMKPRVSKVVWTCDDNFIVTNVGVNNELVVHSSSDGQVHCILFGNYREVCALKVHPTDPRIILSCGSDGQLRLWDIESAKLIWIYFIGENGSMNEWPITDATFNPDGTKITTTQSNGKLCIFALKSEDKEKDDK